MRMIVANLKLGFDLTNSQVRTVLEYNDLSAKFMLIIIAPNLSPSSLIQQVLFILVLG